MIVYGYAFDNEVPYGKDVCYSGLMLFNIPSNSKRQFYNSSILINKEWYHDIVAIKCLFEKNDNPITKIPEIPDNLKLNEFIYFNSPIHTYINKNYVGKTNWKKNTTIYKTKRIC